MGFVRGRDLAKVVLSIWFEVEEGLKQGDFILLKVDFKKAYDKLEWQFGLECLRKMNFGPKFIGWITTLIKKAKAIVQINGKFSVGFPITCSIRQGCPLAPLLFAIATEPCIRGVLRKQD